MVLERRYVVTLHADDELDADDITVYDLERIVLTGAIVERQRDRTTGERKYRIRGQTIGDIGAETVVKVAITGKVVFLTAYTL
jgi:hypothetical protein